MKPPAGSMIVDVRRLDVNPGPSRRTLSSQTVTLNYDGNVGYPLSRDAAYYLCFDAITRTTCSTFQHLTSRDDNQVPIPTCSALHFRPHSVQNVLGLNTTRYTASPLTGQQS